MSVPPDPRWLMEAECCLREAGMKGDDVKHWTPILAERFADTVEQTLQDAYERALQADEHAKDRAIDRLIDERRGA